MPTCVNDFLLNNFVGDCVHDVIRKEEHMVRTDDTVNGNRLTNTDETVNCLSHVNRHVIDGGDEVHTGQNIEIDRRVPEVGLDKKSKKLTGKPKSCNFTILRRRTPWGRMLWKLVYGMILGQQ